MLPTRKQLLLLRENLSGFPGKYMEIRENAFFFNIIK